jgi:hypothetical protein
MASPVARRCRELGLRVPQNANTTNDMCMAQSSTGACDGFTHNRSDLKFPVGECRGVLLSSYS